MLENRGKVQYLVVLWARVDALSSIILKMDCLWTKPKSIKNVVRWVIFQGVHPILNDSSWNKRIIKQLTVPLSSARSHFYSWSIYLRKVKSHLKEFEYIFNVLFEYVRGMDLSTYSSIWWQWFEAENMDLRVRLRV